MSALIPFQFDGREIRVVTDESGEPLFVGKDICDALGYADATTAIRSHCKGVQKRHPLKTAGGMQEMRVLAEPDVLRLIVNCTLPAAQEFERLVFEVILPTIRKTGSYTAPTKAAPKREIDPGLSAVRKAKALEMNIESARKLCEIFPHLGVQGQQSIYSHVIGADVVPLPVLENRTYTATEVGKLLGVSSNAIGKAANSNDLKTPQYGMYVLDKSQYSDKQVESFRYNDAGVARLRALLADAPRAIPKPEPEPEPGQGDLLESAP